VYLTVSRKRLDEKHAVMINFFAKWVDHRFQLGILVILLILNLPTDLILTLKAILPRVLRSRPARLVAVLGVSQHSDNNYNSIPFAIIKYCPLVYVNN
jgi:hypothetical protein